ncbi:MAG: plasmid mobilization relaxosome protein MobC [Ruminococcus sp.]|nr:plasmid mobilization relaxosome protein MobC [Ruminococcus sp.]
MKNEVQKQKKQYKRKGQRKEVLFKDDEWEVVKANAERMNLSTTRYIVKMSLSGDTAPQEISGFTELSLQLSLIGNNLNQLARKANTINNIYAEDYEKMREEYFQLCLLLKQKISMLRRTAA